MSSGDPFGFGQTTGRPTTPPTQYGRRDAHTASFPPADGNRLSPEPEPFDSAGITGPPIVWLLAGLTLGAVAAIVASVAGSTVVVAFGAWFAAGPVAFGLLAAHSHVDARRRASIYTSRSWAPPLYWTTLAVACVGIAVSAWRIAQWAGRL